MNAQSDIEVARFQMAAMCLLGVTAISDCLRLDAAKMLGYT